MGKNPFFEDGELNSSNNNANAATLTAAMFFNTYFTQDEWIDYGKRLRPREIHDLTKMLGLMQGQFSMEGNTEIKTDKGKRKYLYDHFIQPKARPSVKIMLDGGMLQFIQDYQQGKILIDFTLEELIAEARKR